MFVNFKRAIGFWNLNEKKKGNTKLCSEQSMQYTECYFWK